MTLLPLDTFEVPSFHSIKVKVVGSRYLGSLEPSHSRGVLEGDRVCRGPETKRGRPKGPVGPSGTTSIEKGVDRNSDQTT